MKLANLYDESVKAGYLHLRGSEYHKILQNTVVDLDVWHVVPVGEKTASTDWYVSERPVIRLSPWSLIVIVQGSMIFLRKLDS